MNLLLSIKYFEILYLFKRLDRFQLPNLQIHF